MRFALFLLVSLLLLVLMSCGPAPAGTNSGVTTTTVPPQQGITQMPDANSAGNSASPINTPDSSASTSPPANANPFVKLVEEDLANRLQVGVDQIRFLKITDIDWQDLRQGCTTPMGQTQTKGRVSGYQIWLEANGKNYLYHVGLDNTVLFCPDQP